MWQHIILTLQQHQVATRILCWTIMVAAALMSLGVAAFLVMFFISGQSRALYNGFLVVVVVLLVYNLANAALTVWRSCDRCSFRLYPFREATSWDGKVHRGLQTRYPDYLSTQVLGSFRWGAIVNMATKGVTRCVWCGHADGAKLTPE